MTHTAFGQFSKKVGFGSHSRHKFPMLSTPMGLALNHRLLLVGGLVLIVRWKGLSVSCIDSGHFSANSLKAAR